MKLPEYPWTEVMGNNMVNPTPLMLWTPTIITRKTRLIKSSTKTPNQLIDVKYDKDFVKWRIEKLLICFKGCDSETIEALKSLCNEVLSDLGQSANE